MNQEVIMWVMGILITGIGGAFVLLLNMVLNHKDATHEINGRLIHIETLMTFLGVEKKNHLMVKDTKRWAIAWQFLLCDG